jgi:hypothetical protein
VSQLADCLLCAHIPTSTVEVRTAGVELAWLSPRDFNAAASVGAFLVVPLCQRLPRLDRIVFLDDLFQHTFLVAVWLRSRWENLEAVSA